MAWAPRAVAAKGWRHVTTDDGVRVDVREIKGQEFPEFRGIKVFKADIFDILAVLDDAARHCEWQANCKIMRITRKINE
ncbi:MAG TPA: hypothetical protein DCQ06_05515, partial [Myxococcales bacterium]|nr:hypothetical protein [Myxococcales bacterium]